MDVFISWSGERSKMLAQALREWLPLVLHFVKPWVSDIDIAAGQRWSETVAQQLDGSNFGISCVTQENLSAPWLLFEAGALAKSMDESRVIPLLLGLEFRDIAGPLAQFQAKKVDKMGMHAVVRSINGSSEQAIPPERLDTLFELVWPTLRDKIDLIPAPQAAVRPTRSHDEILEELVSTVRSLVGGFDELASTVQQSIDVSDFEHGRGSVASQRERFSFAVHGRSGEDIVKAMAILSPRERDVLRLRYGLDDGRTRTGREVAQLFGLSQGRISQIETEALRKLRAEAGLTSMERLNSESDDES